MPKAEIGGLSSGFLKKGEAEEATALPKAPKPAAGLNADGARDAWILLNAFELDAGGVEGASFDGLPYIRKLTEFFPPF